MISDFFETSNYFVDKKDGFQTYYHIYNDKREKIGRIKQDVSLVQKILRMAVSKTLLPFLVEIRSANGGLEASIFKKGSFLNSEIIIQDAYGKKVGTIDQKFSFFKPEFKILNSSNDVIAEICDVWKKANFIINDSAEKQIGSIDQKWTGTMKDVVRSPSSYNVNVTTNYSNNEEKIAILSSAIIINMFFLN